MTLNLHKCAAAAQWPAAARASAVLHLLQHSVQWSIVMNIYAKVGFAVGL